MDPDHSVWRWNPVPFAKATVLAIKSPCHDDCQITISLNSKVLTQLRGVLIQHFSLWTTAITSSCRNASSLKSDFVKMSVYVWIKFLWFFIVRVIKWRWLRECLAQYRTKARFISLCLTLLLESNMAVRILVLRAFLCYGKCFSL